MIDADQIRAALEDEFPGAEPPPELWDRVRGATPALRPGGGARRRWSRLSLALVWGLLTLTAGGVALAEAPQVKAVVERLRVKPEIVPVALTAADRQQATPLPNRPVTPANLRQEVPEIFKLPAYLPSALTGADVQQRLASRADWTIATWMHEQQSVQLEWHVRAFAPGSRELLDGPALETREISLNGLDGVAFLDNSGWTLMWTMDKHQYTLRVRGLPFDEALKVAESIQ